MKKFTALLSVMPIVRTNYGSTLSAHAVYDPENPEHQKWAQATPAANLTMNVTDEFADGVEPGRYLVTFEKIED